MIEQPEQGAERYISALTALSQTPICGLAVSIAGDGMGQGINLMVPPLIAASAAPSPNEQLRVQSPRGHCPGRFLPIPTG